MIESSATRSGVLSSGLLPPLTAGSIYGMALCVQCKRPALKRPVSEASVLGYLHEAQGKRQIEKCPGWNGTGNHLWKKCRVRPELHLILKENRVGRVGGEGFKLRYPLCQSNGNQEGHLP